MGIFDFILELYASCSGNWRMLAEENGITADECDAFLDYAATFLSNLGNYYVGICVEMHNGSLQTKCRALAIKNSFHGFGLILSNKLLEGHQSLVNCSQKYLVKYCRLRLTA